MNYCGGVGNRAGLTGGGATEHERDCAWMRTDVPALKKELDIQKGGDEELACI